MALLANESWTHGDFFQQKKLKTVEDGSCRVVERGSCVRCLECCSRRYFEGFFTREKGESFP